MLFKKIFGKLQKPSWETTINGGGMTRVCRKTGRKEFRDSKHKKWIPFKDEKDLLMLRRKLLHLNFSSAGDIWQQGFR